jgi:hypothetical protein
MPPPTGGAGLLYVDPARQCVSIWGMRQTIPWQIEVWRPGQGHGPAWNRRGEVLDSHCSCPFSGPSAVPPLSVRFRLLLAYSSPPFHVYWLILPRAFVGQLKPS